MLDVNTGAPINSDVNDVGDESNKSDKIDQFRIV